MTGVADGWSLLRRASFVGAEQNPAYRPARPPLAGPADGAAQLAQRIVELLAAPDCQLILLAVQYTVGKVSSPAVRAASACYSRWMRLTTLS